MLSRLLVFPPLLLFFCSTLYADTVEYEVIDNSYSVCETEQQYRQLLSYSLYGVGQPPEKGCFKAPAGVKAIILHCPESDIILCQFSLVPVAQPAIKVWASKVMLRERK